MAENNNHVLKVVKANVPSMGNLPLKEDGCSLKLAGVEREDVLGATAGDGGYSVKQKFAELELTINHKSSLDLEALNAIDNENITVTTDGGKTYMLPNAWNTAPAEISSTDVKINFHSQTSEFID